MRRTLLSDNIPVQLMLRVVVFQRRHLWLGIIVGSVRGDCELFLNAIGRMMISCMRRHDSGLCVLLC